MNRNDLATNLIVKGLTIEEASHKIISGLTTEGESSQVTTNLIPYPKTADENPLIQKGSLRIITIDNQSDGYTLKIIVECYNLHDSTVREIVKNHKPKTLPCCSLLSESGIPL